MVAELCVSGQQDYVCGILSSEGEGDRRGGQEGGEKGGLSPSDLNSSRWGSHPNISGSSLNSVASWGPPLYHLLLKPLHHAPSPRSLLSIIL